MFRVAVWAVIFSGTCPRLINRLEDAHLISCFAWLALPHRRIPNCWTRYEFFPLNSCRQMSFRWCHIVNMMRHYAREELSSMNLSSYCFSKEVKHSSLSRSHFSSVGLFVKLTPRLRPYRWESKGCQTPDPLCIPDSTVRWRLAVSVLWIFCGRAAAAWDSISLFCCGLTVRTFILGPSKRRFPVQFSPGG